MQHMESDMTEAAKVVFVFAHPQTSLEGVETPDQDLERIFKLPLFHLIPWQLKHKPQELQPTVLSSSSGSRMS